MKEVRKEVPDEGSFGEEDQQTSEVQVTCKTKWEECLKLIKKEIPWQTYRTWFTPIIPVSYIENKLILRISSRFVYEWLDTHFSTFISKIICSVFGEDSEVDYLIAPSSEDKVDLNPAEEIEPEQKKPKSNKAEPVEIDLQLNSRLCLNNFLVHKKNKMAKKAAEFISTHMDSGEYNPLFYYGDVGTGKTHLLNAIGNDVLSKFSKKEIAFLSGEQFLHEYVRSLKNGTINDFKDALTNVDVFLLDDVHYLSNKIHSQETLVYLIKQLLKKNRRIVITSNLAPSRLIKFDTRLVSIFQKGLIVDLVVPGVNTREKIIQNYLSENNIQLADEVIEFLGEKLNANMHILNAVLVRIIAQVSLMGNTISLAECRHIISQFSPEFQITRGNSGNYYRITVDNIIQSVSEVFNIPPDIISGNSRYAKVVLARQVAMYLSRKHTSESLSSIGYHFGDRNHSAVLYACKKMRGKLQDDPELRNHVEQITQKIGT